MSSKRFSRFLEPSTVPLLHGNKERRNPHMSVTASSTSATTGKSDNGDMSIAGPSLNANVPEESSGQEDPTDINSSRPTSNVVAGLFERVNSVRSIAAKNIENLMKRDENLQELEEIATNLKNDSENFSKVSEQMKKQYKNQNRYLMIALIVGSCILLMVVIVWMIVAFS